MKKIRKYELLQSTIIMLPEGSEILYVQEQNNNICIWVLCDPNATLKERVFDVYMTGEDLPDNPGEYIATVHIRRSVVHVFEIKQ
jgi:hypothetical protein